MKAKRWWMLVILAGLLLLMTGCYYYTPRYYQTVTREECYEDEFGDIYCEEVAYKEAVRNVYRPYYTYPSYPYWGRGWGYRSWYPYYYGSRRPFGYSMGYRPAR